MPTESALSNLQLDRAILRQKIDNLTGQMQETKMQRQSLETQHEEATLRLNARIASGDGDEVADATNRLAVIEPELLAVEGRLQSMNQRMTSLQREHALAIGAIHRVEAQAANTAERIKKLKHDLFLMKRKQDPDSPVVQNAIRTIQADLQVSEQRYLGLVGEMFPDEAA